MSRPGRDLKDKGDGPGRKLRPFSFEKAVRERAGTGARTGRYTSVRTTIPRDNETGRNFMLAGLAALLVILWLLGFLVIHAGGALIHILLVVAVIVLVLHFVRGRA